MNGFQRMDYRPHDGDSVELDPRSPFFLDHVARYWWTAELVRGKEVLDCACGRGYGSYILSGFAAKVLGIDLNQESLRRAKDTFHRPNLEFLSENVLELPRLDQTFDAVVAFEIIEHLQPTATDIFLDGIRGILRPEGILLVSTPNHDVVQKSGVVIPGFHTNNFAPWRLRTTLRKFFKHVRMLGQYRARTGLGKWAFLVDTWNLRHVVGRQVGLRRCLDGAPAGTEQAQTARPPEGPAVRELFEKPFPGIEQYRFSPFAWRQAGLTVAVCRQPRKSRMPSQ